MKKVTKSDAEFLCRLSGLYESLTHSAVQPVVIHEHPEEDFLGGRYYDACDNEDSAIAIMKYRTTVAGEDIKKHRESHVSFLEQLRAIDNSIPLNNQNVISDSTEQLCSLVSQYLDFVEEHKTKLENNSFLNYPSCPSGHYFHIQGYNMIPIELKFNTPANKFHANGNLEIIKMLVPDFRKRKNQLPYNGKVASQIDAGEGIFDCSLRGRIALNQELLKRVGFEF